MDSRPPGDPYLWILICQMTSKTIRKYIETIFKHIIFANLEFHCLSILEMTGTENSEHPSNKISKFMDMTPISIKKHAWDVATMVPTSITKHKMTFRDIEFLL